MPCSSPATCTTRSCCANPAVLELTSSSIRTGERGDDLREWVPGSQVWAVQADAFAAITVDVRGPGDGAITLEARGADGELLHARGTPCRTVWNLDDGALS
ncbi:MAG: hypothetical protein KIT31_27690 [Deltaproteobacteria bacterium]|nr:hypothetical protein [Deltaproteobacteria bacterium]